MMHQLGGALGSQEQSAMLVDQTGPGVDPADINNQMQTLMTEPFVMGLREFFQMALEKLRSEPQKRNEFLNLCRTLNRLDDNSYEDPLKRIFNLFLGMDPLTQIFVDLLPTSFAQRLFPKIEENFVKRFNQEVQEKTSDEVFQQYVQIIQENYTGLTSTEQCKLQMEAILAPYPSLMEKLPCFFAQVTEPPLKESPALAKVAEVGAVRGPAKKDEKAKAFRAGRSDEQPEAQLTLDEEAKLAATGGELSKKTAKGTEVKAGVAKAAPLVIPALLQSKPKQEVSFFLEKVPEMFTAQPGGGKAVATDFFKLFALYLDGVISSYEFSDLVTDLIDQASHDSFTQLTLLISQRDNSRRDGLDLGQFKKTSMLTKSYFVWSEDYVPPVCAGRYKPGEHGFAVLNDRYSIKTSGTEDYKFKIKNVHEDNLFKNEDDMYAMDHQILQYDNIIRKLRLEEQHAIAWKESGDAPDSAPGRYEPRFLSNVHFAFIRNFYQEMMPSGKSSRLHKMKSTFSDHPIELIEIYLKRLEKHLAELKQEKQDKVAEWKQTGETNFLKSLDHRSFFFKKEQKDLLPAKKQLAEIERIAHTSLSTRSPNQLKGGSSADHEFYCTYTSFKITNIQVYTEADLLAPALLEDAPINLRDPDLLARRPEALPHMRFLLANKGMLELAFVLLLCGPRIGCNITAAEKSKIEDVLQLLVNKYFRLDKSFAQLKHAAKKIDLLSEEEIALLTKKPADYYRAKLVDKFAFATWPDLEETSAPDEKDSHAERNESSHEGSRSNSDSSESRPLAAAELKKVISVQQPSEPTQGLLEPAFREGYSLLFGTHQFYVVFKLIASIYERLVKAKQLIRAKIKLDLAVPEINQIVELEGTEREALITQAEKERFKLFVMALAGTLSQTPHKKLDPSNYEDIVRMFMGDQAYLLFVFDKLITHTLKNLPLIKSSDECQKNLKLFTKFCKQRSQSEHLYLTHFQQLMQSANNFNGTCIRLLYSGKSGILCVHLFSLSPYGGICGTQAPGTQTMASFRQFDAHKQKLLSQNLFKDALQSPASALQAPERPLVEKQQSSSSQPDTERQKAAIQAIERANLRQPVFLNRNRRKMKQVRKHLIESQEASAGDLHVENGLILRQVPIIGKLQYDPQSTDALFYKRRTGAQRPSLAEFARWDQLMALKYREVLESKRKLLEANQQSSSEFDISSRNGIHSAADNEAHPVALAPYTPAQPSDEAKSERKQSEEALAVPAEGRTESRA